MSRWRDNWKLSYDYVAKTNVNPNEKHPVITNVVSIASLNASIHQIGLAINLSPTVRFGPTFAAAIARQGTTTILFFENGNLVATGCKSEWQSLLAMHKAFWSVDAREIAYIR